MASQRSERSLRLLADQTSLALEALLELLELAAVEGWAEWARSHLARARAGAIDASVLDAYGHRDSFSELSLNSPRCPLTDEQLPWGNELLDVLRARVESLANAAIDEQQQPRWPKPATRDLQGWHCLKCDHYELTRVEIDASVAATLVALCLCDDAALTEGGIVRRVLSGDVPGVNAARARTRAAAVNSGIAVSDRHGNMSPCPACGDPDTAVCRWRVVGDRLEPAGPQLERRGQWHRYRPDATTRDLARMVAACAPRVVTARLHEITFRRQWDLLVERTAVLDALRGLAPHSYLVIYDDVQARAASQAWRAAGEYTWELHTVTPSRILLQSELDTDLWQLYAADVPIPRDALPDLFGPDTEASARTFDALGIHALIDSWAGNTQWRVCWRRTGASSHQSERRR